MQTPAEKNLVKQLINAINNERQVDTVSRILNIGAGRSISIEKQLTGYGCKYICDRVDIDDCMVIYPTVDNCWKYAVEEMSAVSSNNYIAAFANYLLEHVKDLKRASREIYRILKPKGRFIASVPNPLAPEILLAKHTPLWFHKVVRGSESWETHYAYNTVDELCKNFESAGFCTIEVEYYSFVEGYLKRFPLGGKIGRLYDRINSRLRIQRLMKDVCIIFEKH